MSFKGVEAVLSVLHHFERQKLSARIEEVLFDLIHNMFPTVVLFSKTVPRWIGKPRTFSSSDLRFEHLVSRLLLNLIVKFCKHLFVSVCVSAGCCGAASGASYYHGFKS